MTCSEIQHNVSITRCPSCFAFLFPISVLDLNAFERQNKAEGLGMVTEEGSGTVNKLKDFFFFTVDSIITAVIQFKPYWDQFYVNDCSECILVVAILPCITYVNVLSGIIKLKPYKFSVITLISPQNEQIILKM